VKTSAGNLSESGSATVRKLNKRPNGETMSRAITTNEEYDIAVSGEFAIIKCWAQFCRPCIDSAPAFEANAARFAARANFYTLDIESVYDFRDIDRVTKLPTYLVARRGEIVYEGVGSAGLEAILQLA